jgi:protoporphyrin/coproporphyrin ferrochelatase
MSGFTGVVLMTYGSPRDLDDVAAYITRVRGGREPTPELLAEFRRRYATIGMSPLIEITRQQALGLQRVLGDSFRVSIGMRFSEPSIASAIQALNADGVDRILGLILSPQYSPILMSGYEQALSAASDSLPVRIIKSWHLQPEFIEVLASRIRVALQQRRNVPVLLTAHSLPKGVVDREPGYVEQLKETAQAVAHAANLAPEQWSFVYQSAGHSPEEWLKPDLLDVLPGLAAAGHREVLVGPVQFLADHLETLYDVDVAGREQAEQAGIHTFTRVDAPNAAPDFLNALASVVRREASVWHAAGTGATWAIA